MEFSKAEFLNRLLYTQKLGFHMFLECGIITFELEHFLLDGKIDEKSKKETCNCKQKF